MIGAVERSNPLPPGVYWVDVFEDNFDAFRDWLHRNSGAVRVERTESHNPGAFESGPARDWYLFRVVSPVQWEGPGFPTIAERGSDTTEGDTVQRPPPVEGPDLPDLTGKITGGALAGFGTVFGLAAGTWLLTKLFRRK